MRKALLIVAMLLLVTPVMAATTITAVNEGVTYLNGVPQATIRISYSGVADVDPNVRAFALDMNVDGGMVLDKIKDFNVGEANGAREGGKSGYGIFPGRFREYVNPITPDACYADPNYNPTTAGNDQTAQGTGLDTNHVIVEMGTLYAGDANRPALSGTLFRIDVNSQNQTACVLTIKSNALRGGVVGNDGNAVATNLPITLPISFTTVVPNILGQTEAAAITLITNAQLVAGTVTTQYSDVCAVNIVMTQNPAADTVVALGSAVNYKKSLGQLPAPAQIIYPAYDPDCNIPIYWSPVATATGYTIERSNDSGVNWPVVKNVGSSVTFDLNTVPVGPNYRWRVKATSPDSTSLYKTGSYDCNAILSTCYRDGNTADANWSGWRAQGRPDCWCKARPAGTGPRGTGYQCDGDANQDSETVGTVVYRVYNSDMTRLTNNWKKTSQNLSADPNLGVGSFHTNGSCADIDHKGEVVGTVSYRVYNNDMSRLTFNWKKLSSAAVPGPSNLPGNCPR